LFEPFEDLKDVYTPFSINKQEYPEFFRQGVANLSFIETEVIVREEKRVIKITNNQPDHGAYSEVKYLLIDPLDGKVLE